MEETDSESVLERGLARAMARCGSGPPKNLRRLTGGATMESWRFEADDLGYVLRRAPSLAFMEGRPFGHTSEAAIIRAAHAAGVTAPEVVVELEPDDAIGSGFVMHALPGTPDPRAIQAMVHPGQILGEVARNLARIHSLRRDAVPADVPVMDYREGIAGLRQQFEEAGGDRSIIALGLKWLEDNCPDAVEPVLNHGDYRLGNILCEDSRLTGVLDWELAHFGDPHEDLAFGCMPVWRFSRHDRPALGLGDQEEYFAAYEAAGGRSVDLARFRFWSVYRTVWWALGCLRNARMWREGHDRMLERVVISRRTSEQELDLLLLLEEDASENARARPLPVAMPRPRHPGEADGGEIAIAVAEWLETIKDRMEGHDRFQLAVARNALGILARDWERGMVVASKEMATAFLCGDLDPLADGELLSVLRHQALEKVAVDSPKYPSLAIARRKWKGEG